LEPAYYHQADDNITIQRGNELQRPVAGQDLTDLKASSASKTEVGGADHAFESATENLNSVGSGLIVAGYVAAPFTDGASLGLVGWGEAMNTVGTGVSVTHDVLKKDYGNAVTSFALTTGFGKLGDVVKDAKGIETTAVRTTLRATVAAGSLIADKLHEKFKADHEEKKEVKPEPKKADTQQNKDSEKNAKAFFKDKQ